MPSTEVKALADAIVDVKEKIVFCKICYNITESNPCSICQDDTRDHSIICVVEQPSDIIAMEKIGEYKGVYHVLQGCISPLDGITPEDLRIKELITRLRENKIKEVILATDYDIEGEATALYLEKILKPIGVLISRIAHGIPAGGNLEYADEVTLSKALAARRVL
jgi:recombination protein RecR